MGIAEPDQVVSGVLIYVLHDVIQTPCSQEKWEDEVLLGMIRESEPLQDHQVTYWVSVNIDRLEGGFRCRLFL